MSKVTIAIPTHNRSEFIPYAIESVLKQTYKDFTLLIIDDFSTDKTKEVLSKFKDKRIVYKRNKKNFGILGNWNKCIDLSKSKYLMILGDDDILYPDFLEESMKVFNKHPKLGFSFSHCNKVDVDGKFITKWGYQYTPNGYLNGLDYIFYTLKYGCNLTNSSTVIMNKEVFKKTGKFIGDYSANTFDFNMWLKIAKNFDVYFINKLLADYRIHEGQISDIHWRKIKTGKIGSYLEILSASTALLSNKKFVSNTRKLNLILEKIRWIDKELTGLLKEYLPEL